MLIRPISDTHLNQHDGWWFPLPLETDKDSTLVIAGDLWEGFKCVKFKEGQPGEIRWLDEVSKQFKYVVFIAGNHDYWDTELYGYQDKMIDKTQHLDNVFFLQNDYVVLDGVLFAGSTLWTDFKNTCPFAMWDAAKIMNDYRYIKKKKPNGEYTKIRAEDILQEHIMAVKFFYDIFSDSEYTKVMVTHHSPSLQSKSRIYTSNNEYYCSDLDDVIYDLKPNLIIHGHMHESYDYMIGDSRVICNPKGYYQENEGGFNETLLVEV